MGIEERLRRVEAILRARGLDWDHPRVADEPPKKWRILEPGEVVCSGDRVNAKTNPPSDPPNGSGWRPVYSSVGTSVCKDDHCLYARAVAEEPSKEAEPGHPAGLRAVPSISPGEWLDIRDAYRDATPADVGKLVYVRNGEIEPWSELRLAEVTGWVLPFKCTRDGLDPSSWQAFRYAIIRNEGPAWEPKVGDWVLVTRPDDWIEWDFPKWEGWMNHFDGKVGQIQEAWESNFQIVGFACENGFRCEFHPSWLSPAEAPKPPEPEYRAPVLPGDFDRQCDFSSDGIEWRNGYLRGYVYSGWRDTNGAYWPFCRIKKDA